MIKSHYFLLKNLFNPNSTEKYQNLTRNRRKHEIFNINPILSRPGTNSANPYRVRVKSGYPGLYFV